MLNVPLTGVERMCIKCDTEEQLEEIRRFSKYLVIDTEDGGYRIAGIRADAPANVIEEFVRWYRKNNRYENGRLRPVDVVRKMCIVPV